MATEPLLLILDTLLPLIQALQMQQTFHKSRHPPRVGNNSAKTMANSTHPTNGDAPILLGHAIKS